jgi:lysophospholipase L1-like esterase
VPLSAQEPVDFEAEVRQLKAKNDRLWNGADPVILFTGSSSIRMWDDLQERFPDRKILNTGFGGSTASDLLFYLEPLVLDYRPEKVFIYEGDNDLAEGKKVRQVFNTLQEIAGRIEERNPEVPVVFIAAKPSILRWNLRKKYKRLNRRLERWADGHPGRGFADVWQPMLTGRKLNTSLFIADGLHMNNAGYDLWEIVLAPFVNDPNPVLQ